MMYPPAPCCRQRRLAAEENPRSATQMTFPRVQSRMSALTWRISAESAVFPGQHQTRTGMPSRVTAIPITICGRSSRLSFDLPCARNPAALAGSASPWPSAIFSPRQFRATSSSASSSSK